MESPVTFEFTAELVEEQVKSLVGPVHPNNYTYRGGCVMLACLIHGCDEEKIANFLSLSTKKNAIKKYLRTMREQHFFSEDGDEFLVDWSEEGKSEEECTVALCLDIMVVGKQLTRTPTNGKRDFSYSLIGE